MSKSSTHSQPATIPISRGCPERVFRTDEDWADEAFYRQSYEEFVRRQSAAKLAAARRAVRLQRRQRKLSGIIPSVA